MTTTSSTLILEAFYQPDPSTPSIFTLRSSHFETEAEAADFVALFPKSIGLKVTTHWLRFNAGTVFYASTRTFRLLPNAINGGRNETAIARYRRAVKAAAKQEIPVETVDYEAHGWVRATNAYPTVDAFEAAIR